MPPSRPLRSGSARRATLRALFASALLALLGTLSSVARADTYASGSLIIPMDTTYQNSGMFKAYGLVYALLKAGAPVDWAIKPGKTVGQVDFVATGVDFKTNAAVNAYGYRGGPWIIAAANAAAAVPVVQAWQSANAALVVHKATATFDAPIAKRLIAAPNVAMFADGNEGIARGYLQAAGIPDSTGNLAWPNTSPDMLDPAEVAGPTTTNHSDGKLFDSDGDPVYCQFMSMHWGVNNAAAAPEVVAEVRQFLENPVHFFAECQAVNAFENATMFGRFLTPNGYQIASQPNQVSFYNASSPFVQIDGPFKTVGGSEPAFKLPPGDMYKVGGVTMITSQGAPEGTWDLWMTGYLDGACPPNSDNCSNKGKVSYLGGHQYKTAVPITQNPDSQGTRLFLNSLFDSDCATASGFPTITLLLTGPTSTAASQVTYSIAYTNGGPTVALAGVLTHPLPPGATFVSATGGGTLQNGVVTWNVGNLGVGEVGSVSVKLQYGGFGSYSNTSKLAFKVGLNSYSESSNTVTTLYGADADGDGVVNPIDNCPNNYNPSQDLSNDLSNCGMCGVVCSAANGTPVCEQSVCKVASCQPPYADCNGLPIDGCEYAKAGFSSDPMNCGACNAKCAFPNASALCQMSVCALGTCNAGYANCNGIAIDGCEYATSGFATDSMNCGSCGNVCGPGLTCKNSQCVTNTCPNGFADCNALPADGCEYATSGLATDVANCGGCNLACSVPNATPACMGGLCKIGLCNGAFANCNGLEADGCEYAKAGFATDEANCGGCGSVCAPQNAVGLCSASVCTVGSCEPGFVDLDGDDANGCEAMCTATANTDTSCDGVDDDCDGLVDEEFAGSVCGLGQCAVTASCADGVESCVPGAADAEGAEGDVTCADGIDNDCDGQTDVGDSDCGMVAGAGGGVGGGTSTGVGGGTGSGSGGDGGGGNAGSSAGNAGGGDSGGGPDVDGEVIGGGCACLQAPEPSGSAWLVGVAFAIGFARRRRLGARAA